MSLHRLIRLFNGIVALLLIALIIAAYWYVYRPLPQTSGERAAPVSSRGSIVRDSLGVPHISAANIEDAIFAQGFVTAQDRLFQMDALRRLATGEMAEIAGSAAAGSDIEARRLRLRRIAGQHAAALKPEERRYFSAYARGVNYYIETHRSRLPVEFSLLRYDPRPWAVTDSIAAGLQMFRTLTTSWKRDLAKEAMLRDGNPEKVNTLFRTGPGSDEVPGSNAWAVAGQHTHTGKPVLASDPHLELMLPSTWYMNHLRVPGMDVTGVSLPGLPAVIIGHNARIAWGVTNLQFDVQDLYIEKLDPASGRYLFDGKVEQARLEREIVRVRGAAIVPLAVWVTRHGPIFVSDHNRFLALRWTAAEPGGFAFPFFDLNRASEWQEFRAALSNYPGPAQTFVYADVDGNIGWQAAGKLPVRSGFQGDVPLDGSSGTNEWAAFIPYDELPSSFNPPSGIVVSANQNPFPPDYKYPVQGNFASDHRAALIRKMLAAGKVDPAGMLAIQKDVYSPFLHYLAQEVVAAYSRAGNRSERADDAAALLKNWNGQMEKGNAAPLVIQLTYEHLSRALAASAAPQNALAYEHAGTPAVVEEIVRNRPQGWFEDYDRLLAGTFKEAVDEGARMQGNNPRKWDYGQYIEARLLNPALSRVPLVGHYFNIGPAPMSGSSTTIKQTTRRIAPSMRMVADLANWDNSLQNITIGQSGQILSSHYSDQWNAYYTGQSFPMQFNHVAADSTLVLEPDR